MCTRLSSVRVEFHTVPGRHVQLWTYYRLNDTRTSLKYVFGPWTTLTVNKHRSTNRNYCYYYLETSNLFRTRRARRARARASNSFVSTRRRHADRWVGTRARRVLSARGRFSRFDEANGESGICLNGSRVFSTFSRPPRGPPSFGRCPVVGPRPRDEIGKYGIAVNIGVRYRRDYRREYHSKSDGDEGSRGIALPKRLRGWLTCSDSARHLLRRSGVLTAKRTLIVPGERGGGSPATGGRISRRKKKQKRRRRTMSTKKKQTKQKKLTQTRRKPRTLVANNDG